MIKVTTTITYDKPSEKYIVVGHSTEAEGKVAKWEVTEEIIRRMHSFTGRSWDTLEAAIADIKEHPNFRVKVKSVKPGTILTSSFI